MRALAAITGKDLRRTLRSGFFITLGIVTPLILAYVFSLVFGGANSGRLEIPVGLAEPERAPLSDMLHGLDEAGVIVLKRIDRDTDPAAAIESEDLAAVIVARPGRTADGSGGAVGAAAPGPIEVIADPGSPASAGIVGAILGNYARSADRQRIAAAAAEELGLPPPRLDGEIGPVALSEGAEEEQIDGMALVTASMAVLFVFIIALLGVSSILHERQSGTLTRLLAAPIRRESILGAKTLVSFCLSLVAIAVLIVASTALMGAEWGAPAGLAVLVITVSLAATAVTLLIAGFAKSMDTAAGLQSTVAIILALLGGAMIPLPDEGFIGALSKVSPHHWFLEGLRDLSAGAAWTAALPDAMALLAFALLLGIPGAILTLRRIVP